MADSDIPKIDKLNKSSYALWKFNMSNFPAGKTWNKLTDGSVTLANNPQQFPQADAKANVDSDRLLTGPGASGNGCALPDVQRNVIYDPCLKGTPVRD